MATSANERMGMFYANHHSMAVPLRTQMWPLCGGKPSGFRVGESAFGRGACKYDAVVHGNQTATDNHLAGRLPGVLKVALILGAVVGCQRPASASPDVDARPSARDPVRTTSPAPAPDARSAGGAPAAPASDTSPGYPVNTRPPKDFFDERLLRTLAREASATVVCRLLNLTDLFPEERDPDIFYDASCEVLEVIVGAPKGKPLHFVWQVERDHRMPPPQSELLVYLKARKQPLDGPPPLKWVAVETGVLRYTPALRDRIHRQSKKK
jgi:hypothetical protein